MIRPELNDAEVELIFEALHRLKEDKEVALVRCTMAGLPFVSEDFGIPNIAALIEKIDNEPEVE